MHMLAMQRHNNQDNNVLQMKLQSLKVKPPSNYLLSTQQVVDLNDSLINFAPSKGFHHLSLFKDTFVRDLVFHPFSL